MPTSVLRRIIESTATTETFFADGWQKRADRTAA
jgi:hypothetical protein